MQLFVKVELFIVKNFMPRQELLKTNEELPVLGEAVPGSLLTQDFLNQVRALKLSLIHI